MSIVQFAVIALIVIILFVLIISGKARTLLKAFVNLFVEDLASTPEGAEALYTQQEEEIQEKFYNADNAFKKVAGQRSRCKSELDTLKEKLKAVEQQCERLAKLGDEEGLDTKVEEREDILENIDLHKQALEKLNVAYKATKESRDICEEALKEVRKERRKVVDQMKQDRDMKEIYDGLEGIGANTHTAKLLNRVRERSTDLNDIANGAKEAYETRLSTRADRVNKRLSSSVNDDYKRQLMDKYKK